MVSTLMTHDLDFSGEQDLGIATVAVDRRVLDVKSRCNCNQPRRAAHLARRLAVSQDHHRGVGEGDLVTGSRRVPSPQSAADAAAASRQLDVVVLLVDEPVEAVIGGRATVAAAGWTRAENVDEPRLSLAHRVVGVRSEVAGQRQHCHGQRHSSTSSSLGASPRTC